MVKVVEKTLEERTAEARYATLLEITRIHFNPELVLDCNSSFGLGFPLKTGI